VAEQWLQVSKAARVLDITERTLRKHISEEKIQSKLEEGRRLVLIDTDMMSETPSHEATMIEKLKNDMERLNEELNEKAKDITELKQELKKRDEYLREKDDQREQASHRHDTIVLQLTRQLNNQQQLLEYHESPWYRRWFHRDKKTSTIEEESSKFANEI
jgi:predicted RNase H-like nuclease (RuvC/YqgF family)